jgi:hypothetical protein
MFIMGQFKKSHKGKTRKLIPFSPPPLYHMYIILNIP